MKKLAGLFIVVLFLISIKNIYAYSFDNTVKVYDYAQVLTDKQENKLINNVKKYINKYNIDMVIITVKYYSYDNLNDYISEFYSKNNFGIGDSKSAIILALDIKNKKSSIKTFGSASTLYSEAEIKNMLSYIQKTDNNYNKLVKFIKYSKRHINEKDNAYYEGNIIKLISWIPITVISLFIAIVLSIIVLIKLKRKQKYNTSNYYIVDSLVINKTEDKFITTHTKQINKKDI